jgi:hypothetical protein
MQNQVRTTVDNWWKMQTPTESQLLSQTVAKHASFHIGGNRLPQFVMAYDCWHKYLRE